MPTFDVGQEVDELKFNLVPPPGEQDWRVIPEPTTDQVEVFFNRVMAIRNPKPFVWPEGHEPTVEERDEARRKRAEDEGEAIASAIAAVSSGELTEEEVAELPHRAKFKLMGWLFTALVNPMAVSRVAGQTPATTA